MTMLPAIEKGDAVDFGASFVANRGPVSEDQISSLVNVPVSASLAGATTEQKYVAVISLTSVVLKYDQSCGPRGTQTIGKMIARADADPSVVGTVLLLDSPGGSVAGTEDFARIISSCSKPIVAYVDGMAASAAYWAAAMCDHIMVNGKTSVLGSIGTMWAVTDMRGAYEKIGAKVYELYASTSTKKNEAWRQLAKGEEKGTIAMLDEYDAIFMAAVKEGRGKKLNLDKTMEGQHYLSEQSLEYGLADSEGTLQDAVNLVADMAESGKSKSDRKTNMSLFGTSLPAGLKALAGQAPSAVSKEALETANTALEAENIKGFELVKVEDVQNLRSNAQTVETANADLTKQLADTKAAADKATADLAAATKRAEDAEAKADQFGSQAGTVPANPVSKKESEATGEETEKPSYYSEADRIAAESDKVNATVEI